MRAQIRRVLGSAGFAGAPRLQRMLEYAADATLSERDNDLRESVLAIEVFDRDGSFDPGSDSIVRANARRLREKLDAYYENEGRSDPIRVEMPKGHYRLTFDRGVTAGSGDGSANTRPFLVAGLLLVAVTLAGLAVTRFSPRDEPSTLTEAAAALAGVSLGVEAPVISEALAGKVSAWKIARDLVATLSRETRLRVVPRFNDLAPPGAAADDYRLRSVVELDDAVVRLNVELIARDGGYVVWNRDFPMTPDGANASYLFRKHRLLANLARSGILFDLVSRRSAGFSSEEARLLYVDAVSSGWMQAVENTVGTPSDARIDMLNNAIRHDPGVSTPWSALAGIYAFDFAVEGLDRNQRSRRGHQAVERALALARNDIDRALAEAAAGFVAYGVDLDFAAAERHFERALALGHWPANMHYHLGEVNRFAGHLPEAASHYELARALGGTAEDPWALINLANTYMYLGRYDDMFRLLDVIDSSVAEGNEDRVAPWLRVIAYYHLGEQQKARAELDGVRERMPDAPPYIVVGFLPLADHDDEARALLDRLEAAWEGGRQFPCRDAIIASFFLDDEEGMFRWLERAIEQREVIPRLYGVEFDTLRKQSERFRWAMARMSNLATRNEKT